MTKKDRREIGEGIVSYEARKGPGDVARENAWCLFLILASAAALFSASESFRDWRSTPFRIVFPVPSLQAGPQ